MSSKPKAPILLGDVSEGFPAPSLALTEPDGLLAIGGDLSVERLLLAYSSGIFPWYDDGQPILWWTPNPRLVLFLKDFHVSRSLAKIIKKQDFKIRIDTAFSEVINACAEPRDYEPGTWITEDMKTAYIKLFDKGFAHSVEVWQGEKLVGGVYGVCIGANFFAESMFSRIDNGSKIALYYLVAKLKSLGIDYLDCQVFSEHLESLGAVDIDREVFLGIVRERLKIAVIW